MTENLKPVMTAFIKRYRNVLNEDGEPNEAYKYLAIETFQEHWDIEASDFNQMFRNSFSQVGNLLYHNSHQYMNSIGEHFPEVAREMFRNLFDETKEVAERIKEFQEQAEEILPKIKSILESEKIKPQQDERTISVYLAFRFPEKYTLYKNDFYKFLCEHLDEKPKKTGGCFLHLQNLMDQIIQDDILENEDFIPTYRQFYPKPDWDDKYLMIQNILYVNFREYRDFDVFAMLKRFDVKLLKQYYEFLDEVIANFNLNENDNRLVFNASRGKLAFTIGQRYILVMNNKTGGKSFDVISDQPLGNNYINFDGSPVAYWNTLESIGPLYSNRQSIFDAINMELQRAKTSSFLKHNKKELEKMAFDADYRNEMLEEWSTVKASEPELSAEYKLPNPENPQNLILFGAPGTGKTFALKEKYFPKYTISEQRMSPDAYFEDTVSTLTWWQVIALALLELGPSKVNEIIKNRWVGKKAGFSDSKNIRATVWGNLQFHTVNESTTVKYSQRQTPYIFDKTENKEWKVIESELREQAPEIFDTLEAVKNFKPDPNKEIKHYVFTTFHQSFSYEDFIEGIKPVMEEDKESISYQIENGIFKELCLRAQNDPANRYAIFMRTS